VEQFGNQSNGNLTTCLELISEFDPFLSRRLAKHGNPGSSHDEISCLSSTTRDEHIKLTITNHTTVIIEEV